MKPLSITFPEVDENTEEPDDRQLVARAREGDHAAFYDLVRRHRAKACGIARSMMQDEHLAEDIVQEALVRAFLRLGTLVDGNRFLPWFHRIVRTQAWMKLRRGGRYRREMPFSGLIAPTATGVDSDRGHWESLDRVLFHMRRRSEERIRISGDPSEELLRKEMLDTIGGLLVCLSGKEREIFEAHFFGELSPKEIAELFRITPANVYNNISRAKAKLQNERLRVYVNGYVRQRRTRGLPVKKILDVSIIHFN
ncbi:RNA polymerase sigma factor [Cohnella lupini]|uniref:RNA polymerase sigma factor n=1 Tax=Cohnella lupini TaxID=1294267 RepID=A0A3D9I139_9BACL|nr:RNA polymerase sigma factor [Cohnella lupini]RED55478.1 RNA polymerase sigma factor (sigma-70 family) [Cohnella lupini]